MVNIDVDHWINSFQSAISFINTEQIHSLLQTIPSLHTKEEMKRVLLLTMDAEVIICVIHQKLVHQRAAIASQYRL